MEKYKKESIEIVETIFRVLEKQADKYEAKISLEFFYHCLQSLEAILTEEYDDGEIYNTWLTMIDIYQFIAHKDAEAYRAVFLDG